MCSKQTNQRGCGTNVWMNVPEGRQHACTTTQRRSFFCCSSAMRLVLLIALFFVAHVYGQCTNCSETLRTFRTSIKLEMPYYSTPNSPGLGEPNPKVNYAAFSFHGIERDANDYYCYLETSIELSLSAQLQQDQFIVIAPYFMQIQDQPPQNFIFWDDDSWKEAGNSSKYLPQSLSSFSVIDEVMIFFFFFLEQHFSLSELTKVVDAWSCHRSKHLPQYEGDLPPRTLCWRTGEHTSSKHLLFRTIPTLSVLLDCASVLDRHGPRAACF